MSDEIYSIQEIQDKLKPIFESWALNRVWLFGSYAKGSANAESDVDLRIEGGRMRGLFGFGSFYNDIEAALQKPVDVITSDGMANSLHKDTSKIFAENIKKEEKLIYERKG